MATNNPEITLRPAIPSDISDIATIDIAAHPHHPITRLAWVHPSDPHPLFVARYKHLLSLPSYHFLVATQNEEEGEKIIGLVIWRQASKANEEEKGEDFNPVFPPGANVGLIQYFLAENQRHAVALQGEIGGCAELEVLAVSAEVQRRGVGRMLVGAVVKELDRRGERCYVKSSRVAKGLYEKFGWRFMGEDGEKGFKVELKDYGVEEGYTSWDMIREVGDVK